METDLAKEVVEEAATVTTCETPPSMSMEDFKNKYPEVQITLSLNLGADVVVSVVSDKVFLSSASAFHVAGANSTSPKPLFLYAGGSWISDGNKAKDWLAKPGNEGKGVEFRLESAKSLVPWLH